FNRMSRALEGMRNSLLGGGGWDDLGPELLALLPASAALLVAGSAAFSLALAHERRHGAFAL
ncbi:MAG: hypothetical protein M3N56_07755, partial [Actinomycetota bacterium]|nr:hypothetical protein [Actinomycetota bacterium]